MIRTLRGILKEIGTDFVVVETAGVGFKIFSNKKTIDSLTGKKGEVKLYCHLYVRENTLELYGFRDARTLRLFEMLDSISGIGPKTALGVLDADVTEKIITAIVEKKADFLARTPGIGRKTAERVILELHNKINFPDSAEIAKTMDTDKDLEDALVGLGYSRRDARAAIARLGSKPSDLNSRLREALKYLS